MNKTVWSVHATPTGRFWHVQVDAIAGATQARNAKEIDEMARDFISLSLDLPVHSLETRVQYHLPAHIEHMLSHAAQLRVDAETARREAAAESRRAARALHDMGLTVRDVGVALGVSHQRAQQLIAG